MHCLVWYLGEVVISLRQNLFGMQFLWVWHSLWRELKLPPGPLPTCPPYLPHSVNCSAGLVLGHITSCQTSDLTVTHSHNFLLILISMPLFPVPKTSWKFGLCARPLLIYLMGGGELKPAKDAPVKGRSITSLETGGQGKYHRRFRESFPHGFAIALVQGLETVEQRHEIWVESVTQDLYSARFCYTERQPFLIKGGGTFKAFLWKSTKTQWVKGSICSFSEYSCYLPSSVLGIGNIPVYFTVNNWQSHRSF